MGNVPGEHEFEGRVAIVTGGASGIGRASALAFAAKGASVVVADLDSEGGEETMRMAGTEKALFVETDVADTASAEAMVAAALARFGRLDFAHNNAGVEYAGPLVDEIPPEDWNRVVGVLLTGVWNCIRAEIAHMRGAGGGAIVNTSSALGQVAIRGQAAYVASKHGVVGLTRAAAMDHADNGIRINAVLPGVVETPLFLRAADADPALRPTVERMHPIGRLGSPEEIADAVTWLCSDGSTFVTGHALSVDGGFVIH